MPLKGGKQMLLFRNWLIVFLLIFPSVSYGLPYKTIRSHELTLRKHDITSFGNFKPLILDYKKLYANSPNSYNGTLSIIRLLAIYRYLERRTPSKFYRRKLREYATDVISHSKNRHARAFSYFVLYSLYKKSDLSVQFLWKRRLITEYPESWEAKLIKGHNIKKVTRNIVKPLKGKLIVIDPGHGGKDSGARGYFGIMEKTLVLKIGKMLRSDLRKQGASVLMTRSTDIFIPLAARTIFADKHHADMFVSIHANAARDRNITGIETFFLTTKAGRKTLLIASRDRGLTPNQLGVVKKIIVGLVQNAKINRSSILAKDIQKSILKTIKVKRRNLGVRQSSFYVITGTKMPSVLVETGFISNRNGAKLLLNSLHEERIAKGITLGIIKYFKQD